MQNIPRGEHDPPPENAKRIDLGRRRQADGVMGARRRSDGDEFKKKKGPGPVGVEWCQTRHGEWSAFGQSNRLESGQRVAMRLHDW